MRDPDRLRDKPVGVVQYNPYGDLRTLTPEDDRLMNDSNGSLIAVNYAARAAGVKRNHRGDEARKLCPDLQLVQVPTKHGKADLTLYRDAGKAVLDILSRGGHTICERASIDECYLDLTAEAQARLAEGNGVVPPAVRPEQVHVYAGEEEIGAQAFWTRPAHEWRPGERLLACGAALVSELRDAVEESLGYTCSAGISHTRLLAKLSSGLHKPCQQTMVPAGGVPALLAPLPLGKLKGLGGKFGQQVCSDLGLETVGQLTAVPLSKLEALYGEKDAQWLFALCRGVDDSEVEQRKLPKSVSCGKTFRGRNALDSVDAAHTWLLELSGELEERLVADKEANKRVPQLLTVSIGSGGHTGVSRSCHLRRATAASMAEDAAAMVRRWAGEQKPGWQITDLFLGTSNFVPVQSTAITQFFKPKAASAEGEVEAKVVEDDVDVTGEVSGARMHLPAARDVLEWAPGLEKGGVDEPGPSNAAHLPAGAGHGNAEHHASREGDEGAGPSMPGRDVPQSDILNASSAAVAFGHQDAGPGGSGVVNGGANGGRLSSEIDESVLAELPPEIQAEVRMQMKFDAMAQRAQEMGASGKGLAATGQRRKTGPTGTVTLKAFLNGKRPKR